MLENKAVDIINLLNKRYPCSKTELFYKTPFQLLVATILSAQCTDKMVNKITPGIFEKYNDAAGFAKAKQVILEQEIKSSGFYRNKAKNIIQSARKISLDFGGEVPDSMEDLLTLPGVARKTANIILSSAFKKSEGIAVDTHVKRLSCRLGFSSEKNPDKIEKDLMALFSKKYWLKINYILVNHGRDTCKARKPLCFKCPISRLCNSTDKIK
ncbi:MAG TPA: endonuclease III [Candidatus Omnitrophica bacterium]|nr:endonuclease III [Candidatus Omnitrophota bacterium]